MKMTRKEKLAMEKARRERIAKAQAETRAVVATGRCPKCGSALRRNLSLTGWWQCEQFGAVGFRARSNEPACGWQGFTE
jgi:ssDNA-binding Zn-finger/Zn-ribbon topoisomerase 1